MRRYILTALLLAVLALPAVYTNSIFGYLPIVAAVLLLTLSAIYLQIMRRSIEVYAPSNSESVVRNGDVTIAMKLVNNSVLVCPKATSEIFISDYFGNDDSVVETVFAIDSRSAADFSFDVTMVHVGNYTAGIRNIKIYDLLGVFSVTLPVQVDIAVTVLPQVRDFEVSLADVMYTDSPLARSFLENDGFDYTGVREYTYGDSMKKIHWKLSAHMSGYMTKINEVNLKSDMTIVLDSTSVRMKDEDLLTVNDGLIETAASLLAKASDFEIDSNLLYADRDDNIIPISSRDEFDTLELVQTISPIKSKLLTTSLDAERMMKEESRFHRKSSNIIVCTSRVTESLLQSLVQAKEERRNPILYYVVAASANRSDRHDASARVRMLDEYGIYYEVISV